MLVLGLLPLLRGLQAKSKLQGTGPGRRCNKVGFCAGAKCRYRKEERKIMKLTLNVCRVSVSVIFTLAGLV